MAFTPHTNPVSQHEVIFLQKEGKAFQKLTTQEGFNSTQKKKQKTVCFNHIYFSSEQSKVTLAKIKRI